MTNTVLALMGALGGLVVFVGACWTLFRAVVHQTDATKDNTRAVERLIERLDAHDTRLDNHEVRISVLEDRRRSP